MRYVVLYVADGYLGETKPMAYSFAENFAWKLASNGVTDWVIVEWREL